jgi:hypothetical protein
MGKEKDRSDALRGPWEWNCTRCHRPIKGQTIGWLIYDQHHDLYIDLKRSCEIGRNDHPDATAGMTDSEVEEYLSSSLSFNQTLGSFPFGPECVKKVNGKGLDLLRERDKDRSNPKTGTAYWDGI